MRSEEDMRREQTERGEESMFSAFGRTVREIVANIQEIIRSEVRLARTEVKEEINGVRKIAAFYGSAAACAFYALGFLLLAAVYALAGPLPPWLAALIIGVCMVIVSGILVLMARKQTQRLSLKAEQTMETAKENVRWAKNRFK